MVLVFVMTCVPSEQADQRREKLGHEVAMLAVRTASKPSALRNGWNFIRHSRGFLAFQLKLLLH